MICGCLAVRQLTAGIDVPKHRSAAEMEMGIPIIRARKYPIIGNADTHAIAKERKIVFRAGT